MAGLRDIYDRHRGVLNASLLGATVALSACATPRGDQSFERGYPPQQPTVTGSVRDAINEAAGCPPENDSCANAAAVNAARIQNGIRILESILD